MQFVTGDRTLQEADAIACNPDPQRNHIFACAQYHLNEETKKRVGGITLYTLDEQNGKLQSGETIERAGVLDCCWNPDGNFLLSAEADGKLGCFQINSVEDSPALELSSFYQLEPESIALAVDWNVTDPQKTIGSFSDGRVVLSDITAGDYTDSDGFEAHTDAEVWTVAFSKHSPFLFQSGGDDCRLKLWDSRQSLTANTPLASKRYDMGVTTIQSSPFDENLFAVGSYDETVSIWDRRNMRRAVSDVRVGGGVWRIKWNPADPTLLLVACMYNEFHLVQYQDDTLSLYADRFGSPHHEVGKLAYGADWFTFPDQSGVVSHAAVCSFYDSSVSCWKLDKD